MMKLLKAGTGVGKFVGNRGPLCNRDDTRSSPHPSMVTLGCLNEGDEGGNRQGHYLSWLSLRPEMGSAIRIG
jgi:hypothetical protein